MRAIHRHCRGAHQKIREYYCARYSPRRNSQHVTWFCSMRVVSVLSTAGKTRLLCKSGLAHGCLCRPWISIPVGPAQMLERFSGPAICYQAVYFPKVRLMIDDFLDLARLKSGRTSQRREIISSRTLINNASSFWIFRRPVTKWSHE